MERLEKWFGFRPKEGNLQILPSETETVANPAGSKSQEQGGDKQVSDFILETEENSGFKLQNLLKMSPIVNWNKVNQSNVNEIKDPSPTEQTASSPDNKISTASPSQQNSTSAVSNVNDKNARPHTGPSQTSVLPMNDIKLTTATSVKQTDPSTVPPTQPKSGTENECVQCQVIGSTVAIGAAAFVLYQGWKNQGKYTGFKKFAYQGQYIFLSLGLTILSVSVAFKVGLYKPVTDGEKRTLFSLLKDDYEMFKDKLSWPSSSASSK